MLTIAMLKRLYSTFTHDTHFQKFDPRVPLGARLCLEVDAVAPTARVAHQAETRVFVGVVPIRFEPLGGLAGHHLEDVLEGDLARGAHHGAPGDDALVEVDTHSLAGGDTFAA